MQLEEFWPQLDPRGELWSINVYASEVVFPRGEGAGLPCSCAKSHAWEHVWLYAPVGKGAPVASSENHWSAWNSPKKSPEGWGGEDSPGTVPTALLCLRQDNWEGVLSDPHDSNQVLFPSQKPNKTLLRSNVNAVNKSILSHWISLRTVKEGEQPPHDSRGKGKPFRCPAQSPLFFNIIKCFSAKYLKVAY